MTKEPKSELLELLRAKSVFRGEFTLASGAKSNYYVDCKLTTLDPRGAWLAGHAMYALIREEEAQRKIEVKAIGGLTMGSDPIALATGMVSFLEKRPEPLQVFSVRKAAKAHGQGKRIEGNFPSGDWVVVIDDVITKGESTLQAIEAVREAGGKIAFIAALLDRQEGGRDRIEQLGYQVVSVFTRADILDPAVATQTSGP